MDPLILIVAGGLAFIILLWFLLKKGNKKPVGPKARAVLRSFQQKGIQVEVLSEGKGAEVIHGKTVSVSYEGRLTSGGVFDQNANFSFRLGYGKVIKGWDDGVKGMRAGETRRLTIPPELGYGAAGAGGGRIPPNATLIFEIKLLRFS